MPQHDDFILTGARNMFICHTLKINFIQHHSIFSYIYIYMKVKRAIELTVVIIMDYCCYQQVNMDEITGYQRQN
jgi:hypothetical protein